MDNKYQEFVKEHGKTIVDLVTIVEQTTLSNQVRARCLKIINDIKQLDQNDDSDDDFYINIKF